MKNLTLTFWPKKFFEVNVHVEKPGKNFGPPKFCWNFSEIFRFFSSNSEKNIIFRNRFSRKILLNDYDFWQFSINPWYVRVYGKLRKLKKVSFKGLEKRPRNIVPILRYLDLACLPLYIGRIPVNCQ